MTAKLYPTRLTIEPGLSGLDVTSYAQVEQVRTISIERLTRRRGRVTRDQLHEARILRILLED